MAWPFLLQCEEVPGYVALRQIGMGVLLRVCWHYSTRRIIQQGMVTDETRDSYLEYGVRVCASKWAFAARIRLCMKRSKMGPKIRATLVVQSDRCWGKHAVYSSLPVVTSLPPMPLFKIRFPAKLRRSWLSSKLLLIITRTLSCVGSR